MILLNFVNNIIEISRCTIWTFSFLAYKQILHSKVNDLSGSVTYSCSLTSHSYGLCAFSSLQMFLSSVPSILLFCTSNPFPSFPFPLSLLIQLELYSSCQQISLYFGIIKAVSRSVTLQHTLSNHDNAGQAHRKRKRERERERLFS